MTINEIADALTPQARRELLKAMHAMAQQVDLPKLTHAIKQRNVVAAIRALRVASIPKRFKPLRAIIETAFTRGGQHAAKQVVKMDATFTMRNPLAIQAAAYSGEKITVITEQTRAAIRQLIRKGLVEGIEPVRLAREIKPLIGLNVRQAIAVQNARAAWAASGMTQAAIDKAAARYIEKQRKYRALMIARTETIGASNAGQLRGWQNAMNTGLLTPTTKRRWVATKGSKRTCDICEHQMHGQVVAFHERFVGPKGMISHPPVHPNCRCTVVLQVPKAPTVRLPRIA